MLMIERNPRISNHVYDYLLAYSMKFYGIDKIVTLNKADFERYDFIKEIISP